MFRHWTQPWFGGCESSHQSVIRALETCPFPDMPLEVRTDSQYTIMCMTTYLPGWLRNGFKTSAKKTATLGGVPYARGDARSDVKNADMIKHLLVLLRRRGTKAPVRFKHVRGHIGVEGNEGADVSCIVRSMGSRAHASAWRGWVRPTLHYQTGWSG
jgi:ribonuclease HI